jgi:arabinose-5-phosphate isomerase
MNDHPNRNDESTRIGRALQVIRLEAEAILSIGPLLDESFDRCIDKIMTCRGRVVLSGIGKAGLIGNKISATLASTGTPSFFLHPAEAFHGDLGRVTKEDVVILMSNSGESNEVTGLIDPLRRIGPYLVAMTGNPESSLGRGCDVILNCGRLPEACPMGLAPTTSTAALLALGDALAMVLIQERKFDTESYARFHPGGALGRQLMRTQEIMRTGDSMTVVVSGSSARETLIAMNSTKGRPGAAMIIDQAGRLIGFFTDGDLARNLQRDVGFLNEPVDRVMVRTPTTITADRLASEAFRILREGRFDQLPVVDDEHRPVGLVDVQDLLDARIV